MDSCLKIKDLHVHFSDHHKCVHAVRGLDLSIPRHKITGIVGESGSGKTQTFFSIFGLSQATNVSGSAYFHETDLLSLSKKKLRKLLGKEVCFIFQDPMGALNPYMTIGSQMLETVMSHQDITKHEAMQMIEDLLHQVKMNDVKNLMKKYPYQLSGGQQQRVIIAMAIVNKPQLIIADEPTTALDVSIQADILALIHDIQKALANTIIIISHDLGVIARLCDHIIVMYAGQAVEQSTTEQFFRHMKHPYSQALMASVPHFNMNADDIRPIPGQPPSLDHAIEGCAFAPRCSHAMEICKTQAPRMRKVSLETMTACHLYPQEET